MSRTGTAVAVPKNVAVLGLGVFLVGWGTNVSTPILVLYQDRLDLGDSATMAIFTVYVAGILGTLPLAGPLSDKIGRRLVVLPSVALSATASIVMIFGRDELAFLLAGRFLLGVVSGAVFGVSAAWLQELVGSGNEHRAAVLFTLITYAGFGIGPPISAVFERFVPSPLVAPYLLHAAATTLVLALLLSVPETNLEPNRAGRLRIELGVPRGSSRSFWTVIVPAAVWVFAFPSASFALFPVLVSSSISDAEVAVAAASGALTAWSALLARPLLVRAGPRRALVGGMAMGTVGYACGTIAFASDVWPLVLPGAVLLGAASGTLTAAALALLGEMADRETRGALNSTFYLLAYPGMAMPIVLTTIGSSIGTSRALVLVSIVSGVATILSARTYLRQRGRGGVRLATAGPRADPR